MMYECGDYVCEVYEATPDVYVCDVYVNGEETPQ